MAYFGGAEQVLMGPLPDPSPFERGGYLGNSAFGAVTNNCWFEPQFRTDIRSALES